MYFSSHSSISYYRLNGMEMWFPVSSTSKVSNGCIRDLGFNLRLHQKLIGVLF